jgi:enoyl-CoA hydratase/carnithine racemase
MTDCIRTEVADGVATISLNRPERHNAFTDELEAALDETIASAIADRDARAILVRGEGRSFSSGGTPRRWDTGRRG